MIFRAKWHNLGMTANNSYSLSGLSYQYIWYYCRIQAVYFSLREEKFIFLIKKPRFGPFLRTIVPNWAIFIPKTPYFVIYQRDFFLKKQEINLLSYD